MKIQTKILWILGITAFSAIFTMAISSLIFFHVIYDESNQNMKKELKHLYLSDLHGIISGERKQLEQKIGAIFQRMEYISQKPDDSTSKGLFNEQELLSLLTLKADSSGNYTVNEILNPAYQGKTKPQKTDSKVLVSLKDFLRYSKLQKERTAVMTLLSDKGILWIVLSKDNGSNAVFCRVDTEVLLQQISSLNNCRTELFCGNRSAGVFAGENAAAGTNQDKLQQLIRNLPSSGKDSEILFESIENKNGRKNVMGAVNVNLPTETLLSVRLGKIYYPHQIASSRIHEQHYKSLINGIVQIAGTVLIIFLIILLIMTYRLSESIRKIQDFINGIHEKKDQKQSLQLNFSSEFKDISEKLIFLKEKMNSVSERLLRSHDRELQARKETESSNQFRAALLLNTSSEISRELTTISGYSDILRHDLTDEGFKKIAEHIFQDAGMISKSMRLVTDIARYEAEEVPELEYTRLGPHVLLGEIVRFFLEDSQTAKVTIEIHSSSGVPKEIVTDRAVLFRCLQLAFTALLQTVQKHSRIKIGCRNDGEELIFWLNAQSIPNAIPLAEAFEKSKQNNYDMNEFRHGEGAAVLRLLKLYKKAALLNGDISVLQLENPAITQVEISLQKQSVTPEKDNTTAFITKEVTSSTNTFSGMLIRNDQNTKKRKVRVKKPEDISLLIVSARTSERMMLRMMLGKEKYRVFESENEQDCFRKLAEHYYDVILIDGDCGTTSDYLKFAADIRKGVTGQPILIALRPQQADYSLRSTSDSGFDRILDKPVSMEILLHTLHGFIDYYTEK